MLLVPDTILQNRYRIIRQIGQGGMGAVYEAAHLQLKSRVALKQMLVSGAELSRQFEREAQLLANLRHAALPRVIDHFSEASGQFLVMEYIPGDDLATLLRQRGAPFPVADVLHWADQLLSALHYLHTRRPPVIHRDIKPQNLKLYGQDEIVLLDFGLAKGSLADMTAVTGGQSIVGHTPGYAPPEQLEGTGTDERSDLYSLGATLYCLLTNKPPPDAFTRLTRLVRRAPDPLRPVHDLNPAVPAAINTVLQQALALNPAERPPNAEAMRDVLQAESRSALPPMKPAADSAPTPFGGVISPQPSAPPRPSQSTESEGTATSIPNLRAPMSPVPSLGDQTTIQAPRSISQMRAEEAHRNRGWWALGAVAAVLLVLALGFLGLRNADGDTEGIVTFSNLSKDHSNDPVAYQQIPPVGGPHSPAWQNCGIYDQPIPNETAVHSLEHGAVWITYRADLPGADVEQLRSLVRGNTRALLSPYPGLPARIVASAWGLQLKVEAATDRRLARFLDQYAGGPQTPEPGASCRGGEGLPLR